MAIESTVPDWLRPYYDQQGLFGTIAPTNYGSRTAGAESFFSSLPSYTYSNLVSQQPVSYQQMQPYTRRRNYDTNAPTIEDIEAELGLAGTVEPTVTNALGILGNLTSFALGPFGFFTTLGANLAANKNKVALTSLASLAKSALTDIEPGTAAWDAAIGDLAPGISEDEAPGGIDYSGEVGGYNDPSGIDQSFADLSPGYGGYAGSEGTGGIGGLGGISSGPDASPGYGGYAGSEGTADVSGYTDASLGDISDFGGYSGGEGGGGGGDGGKVICTELHRQGILSKTIYLSDQEFGRKLAIEDPEAFAGYHAWAIPVVSLMKKSSLFTRFVAVFALPWAREMHYMETGVGKSSLLGRCMVKFGVPLCRFIGRRSSTELSSG